MQAGQTHRLEIMAERGPVNMFVRQAPEARHNVAQGGSLGNIAQKDKEPRRGDTIPKHLLRIEIHLHVSRAARQVSLSEAEIISGRFPNAGA